MALPPALRIVLTPRAAAIPAGRVGEVEDIAQAYLFCLSQPFATGSIVTVDGGAVLA